MDRMMHDNISNLSEADSKKMLLLIARNNLEIAYNSFYQIDAIKDINTIDYKLVKSLLADNKKIYAIKYVRMITNLGLLTAKRIIDAIQQESN